MFAAEIRWWGIVAEKARLSGNTKVEAEARDAIAKLTAAMAGEK